MGAPAPRDAADLRDIFWLVASSVVCAACLIGNSPAWVATVWGINVGVSIGFVAVRRRS